MNEGIEEAKIVNDEHENAVVVYIKGIPADEETKLKVKEAFADFCDQADEWERKAKELVVTSSDQVREMQMARTARLALADIRIEIEKRRKALGDESLRKKQAIDSVAKLITSKIEPTEQYLKLQEKFAELEEQKKKDEIKNRRMQEMMAAECSAEGLDLANLPEEVYQGILTNAANLKQQRIEAEQKAIEAEVNRKKAEAEEQERIRQENETLQAEIAEKERKLKEADELLEAQRKTAEAERIKREKEIESEKNKIQAEHEEKIKAEMAERLKNDEAGKQAVEDLKKENERLQHEAIELTQKIRSDSPRPQAEPEEEIKMKLSPEQNPDLTEQIITHEELVVTIESTDTDTQKLMDMKKLLFKIEYPEMETKEGKNIMANVEILIQKVINWISQNEDKVPSEKE